MSEERLTEKEFHTKMAKQLFNKTWDLMLKEDRQPQETTEMMHTAHASAYHWLQVGEPVNHARSQWLLSRVYFKANMGEMALYHAKECEQMSRLHSLSAFDIAFAHEAMARAYALQGDVMNTDAHKAKALEAGAGIAKDPDRKYLEEEIKSIQL